MPGFKELPPYINGFKVIKDLGCAGGRRFLIAECKVCERHFKNERDSLKLKHRRSCGCLLHYPHQENLIRTNIPNRLRSTYSSMKERCYNQTHMNYKSYGALGIKLCDEWYKSSAVFYKWALENGYKDSLTIDRIDPLGNYEPDNCRFVSMAENIQSRRSITKLNPDKVRQLRKDFYTMTTRDVAKKWGMHHRQIMDIKSRKAWNNVQDE